MRTRPLMSVLVLVGAHGCGGRGSTEVRVQPAPSVSSEAEGRAIAPGVMVWSGPATADPAGAIIGQVRNDGQPAVGALITVTSHVRGVGPKLASTNEAGHYELRGLAAGTYDISFLDADSEAGGAGLVVAAGGTTIVNADLPPPAAASTCPEESCQDGFTLGFSPPLLLDRGYRLELRADGESIECVADPTRNATTGCGGKSFTCSSPRAIVFPIGCDPATLDVLRLPFLPRAVHVTLSLGAAVIFDRELKPEYERFYPNENYLDANGVRCGQGCVAGGYTVPLTLDDLTTPNKNAADPWLDGKKMDTLLAPWATCATISELVDPELKVRARPTLNGVLVEIYSAGSGREATSSETLVHLNRGSCDGMVISVDGAKDSSIQSVTLDDGVGFSDASVLLGAVLPDLPVGAELAAARALVLWADADPPAAAAPDQGVLGPAMPDQPEYLGRPRGSPQALWDTHELARAGVASSALAGEDGDKIDDLLTWPVRAPTLLATQGDLQLWETRFRSRLGGGVLAVYDARRDRHRWLLATVADERLLRAKTSHFDLLLFSGELALVRTHFDGRQSLWAIDVASGVARPVLAGEEATFARGKGGVVVSRDQEPDELIPLSALRR